jgi:hypothetical protein
MWLGESHEVIDPSSLKGFKRIAETSFRMFGGKEKIPVGYG